MSNEKIDTVGLGMCFEDLPVGRKFKTIGRTIQDADICNFINVIHMTEVLFTDMEFLRHESDIKGRLAPGSLVYCFAEGLLAQATMQKTGYAFLGMELDIKNPAFAGDTCMWNAKSSRPACPKPAGRGWCVRATACSSRTVLNCWCTRRCA